MCKTKKKNNLFTLNFKKILLVYACMSYGLPKPLRERERERGRERAFVISIHVCITFISIRNYIF